MASTLPVDEILVPERPDLPGLSFRHLRIPDDYPGMAAANQASRDHCGIEEVITADTMARDYAHWINWDPEEDTLVVERDGRIVGYGRTEWRDLTDGTRGFRTVVMVHPAQYGHGLAGAMLGWAERRLMALATTVAPDDPRPSAMTAFSFGAEVELAAALEGHGWDKTGQGYEMVRPTLDDVPETPMPAGLVVRPVGIDTAARRRVFDASSEAFRDERGEAETGEEEWEAFRTDPREDPALWIVAFDGDEIAGGVLGKIDPDENAHHGRERGIVAAVFTRRPWRRRGLARALIARALVRLRDHGMTSAYLGVDGLNPNQAMDLYESLGFTVASTSFEWHKPLPAATRMPPVMESR
jgi:GNAT superfamily N-acetyltransferase